MGDRRKTITIKARLYEQKEEPGMRNGVYYVCPQIESDDMYEKSVLEEMKKALAFLTEEGYGEIRVAVDTFVRQGDGVSYAYGVLSDVADALKSKNLILDASFSTHTPGFNHIKREFTGYLRDSRGGREKKEDRFAAIRTQIELLNTQIEETTHRLKELCEKGESAMEKDPHNVGALRSIEKEISSLQQRIEWLNEMKVRVEHTLLLYMMSAPSMKFDETVFQRKTDNADPFLLVKANRKEDFARYLGNGEDALKDAVEKYMEKNKTLFCTYLAQLIDQKGLRDPEVYKNAGISKETFHKIMNSKVSPKRKTVAALAIGLRLDEEETGKLYEAAGYTFGRSEDCDLVIRFFIEAKEYDIEEVNAIMCDMTGHPLTGETRMATR